MKKYSMRHLYVFVISVQIFVMCSFCSCGNKVSYPGAENDTIAFRYAHLLKVENFENHKVAYIKNPWKKDKILHTYLLVPKNKELPDGLPDGTVVRTPLERTVVTTSVHCGLLSELGRLRAVAGACDCRYVLHPMVSDNIKSGKIKDMGVSMQPDIEPIAELCPDAILVSPFSGSGGYGKLEKLGVPLIECADYMESSPLARAEWMRFFGLLYGCEETADSLFSVVESSYMSLKDSVADLKKTPRLMCDLMQGAAWYVPGGQSTIGAAFKDAGAEYIFGNDNSAGSIGKSFETVYSKGLDADVWVIRRGAVNDMTYSSLKKEREAYSHFRPWKDRKIYVCNTLKVPYFDESPFRPDYLLSDLVHIVHPELCGDESLHYFSPVNE